MLVKLARALVRCATHFLTHNLAEGTIVASWHFKCALGGFGSLNFGFFHVSRHLSFLEGSSWSWLPSHVLQLRKLLTLSEKSLTRGREQVDHVVHFEAFIQHARQQVNAIRGERDSHCAVALGLWLVVVDLGHLGEVPKVNLTLQVAKATQHHNLGEGAHADSVAVPLSKFEKRCAVLIVQCCNGWLDASDDDEILAVGKPANIVNRVVETRHERAVSPTENLDVLQRVLSIITLSGLVGVVLGPDQNSVAGRAEIRVDLLTLGTLDHELRLGRHLRIQIKSVDDTDVIFSRHDFSCAPRKEVKWALLRL